MYLSYSGRKSYKTCPKQYEHRYVLKTVAVDDPRSSLFGSIIGKLFEWFYEKKFWAAPDPTKACLDAVEDAIDLVYGEENFTRAQDPGFTNLLRQELLTYVPAGVDTIRKHGFLSVSSRAEEDLSVVYTSQKHDLSLKMGGRCDFVHGRDKLDIWILDGKGSKHREKYVDAEQLIWYASQHYLKYHVAPTRLGFIFWKFPQDPVKWIDYTSDDIRKLVQDTFDVAKKIQLKVFGATPSGECHRCDYRESCDDGKKYLAKRRVENGGRIESSIFDLESTFEV